MAAHCGVSSVKIVVILNVAKFDVSVTLTVLIINLVINYGIIEYLQVGGAGSGSLSPTSQDSPEFTWNSSQYQQSINLYSVQGHFIPIATMVGLLKGLNVQYKPCAYEF